jgi:hypothetical protein
VFKRLQVFDIVLLLNTLFVACGALACYRWADAGFLQGFLYGGALGWINNLVFRMSLRVVAARSWLWKVGVVFFTFLFGFKLLLNFWAIYYLIVVMQLDKLAFLGGLVPGVFSVFIGSLIYSRRLKAS